MSPELNGQRRQVLTFMPNPMRSPSGDIVDLYAHRWEIKLGDQEMEQYFLTALVLPVRRARI